MPSAGHAVSSGKMRKRRWILDTGSQTQCKLFGWDLTDSWTPYKETYRQLNIMILGDDTSRCGHACGSMRGQWFAAGCCSWFFPTLTKAFRLSDCVRTLDRSCSEEQAVLQNQTSRVLTIRMKVHVSLTCWSCLYSCSVSTQADQRNGTCVKFLYITISCIDRLSTTYCAGTVP